MRQEHKDEAVVLIRRMAEITLTRIKQEEMDQLTDQLKDLIRAIRRDMQRGSVH